MRQVLEFWSVKNNLDSQNTLARLRREHGRVDIAIVAGGLRFQATRRGRPPKASTDRLWK